MAHALDGSYQWSFKHVLTRASRLGKAETEMDLLNNLATFLRVAELRSFSAAARDQDTTQPAVS